MKVMKQLYFVRHGQSQANLDEIYAGQFDTPLTDYGREQAKIAGMEAVLFGIDLIVSSPLSRAFETATIIAEQIGYSRRDIRTSDLLKERSFGSLQGKSWHDYAEDDSVFKDVESLEHLGGRAQRFLNYVHKIDSPNILVVGHGSFANALCDIIGYDTNRQELPNAKIVQLL